MNDVADGDHVQLDELNGCLSDHRHVVGHELCLGADPTDGLALAELGEGDLTRRGGDAFDPGRRDRLGSQQEPCDAPEVMGTVDDGPDSPFGLCDQGIRIGVGGAAR